MSDVLGAAPSGGARRPAGLTADERARLTEVAAAVGRAALFMRKRGCTALSKPDLEALGMLAVWRSLPEYDERRATFDDWAFYRAQHAMWDAWRRARRGATFEGDLRAGARGYVAQDDRPAALDVLNDTPEVDRRRLSERARGIGVSAWLAAEQARGAGSLESWLERREDVRQFREDVDGLPEPQRSYVRMRFWEDAEVAEVAQRMAIPERTLRRRWAEARDTLVKLLAGRGIYGVPEGFGEAADELAAGEEIAR